MPEPSGASAADELESISTHNQYIVEAIKTYCKFRHPQGFAIMIDGRWGSGKTHLVKSMLHDLVEQKSTGPQKPLYISLYGVSTRAEIDEQIYQQLHPLLGHKYTRIAGAVLKGFLKTAVKIDLNHHHDSVSVNSQFPELKMSDVVEGATQRVVIFDDFERAVMSPSDVLGYINPLVEHDGCKVIILVNEEEVLASGDGTGKSDQTYKRRKEKTIGQTFRVKADADYAFDTFLAQVDETSAKIYLRSQKSEILSIFKDSGLENLRLLKQFLWNFEKFWSVLSNTQRSHDIAMRELLTLLCAATLELRWGRVSAKAYRRADVGHHMMVRRSDPDPDVMTAESMFKRYPTANFESTLLAPETVLEIVLHSKVCANEIQRQLQAYPYFTTSDALPSWKALWHGSDLNAAELDDVLSRFAEDFAQRTFRSEAEILHVVGLCLWLSDIAQPGWDRHDIVDKLKAYVDDVYQASEADLEDVKSLRLERMSGGAFGLGFLNVEDPRFTEIVDYLDSTVAAWRRRSYPKAAARLRQLMTEDSEAFLRDVCFTNAGSSRYARSAVLSCIPAGEFAAEFAGMPHRDQSKIAMALSIRYEQVQGEPELRSELPWLTEVHNHAMSLTDSMSPIRQYHVRNLLKIYLCKHIPSPPPT